MSLSPAFLDELRHRTTLSTLIGRTLKLQKNGNEWKACCPFHNEKTPSFYVNDDKAFYHCFGCSAHGDAIRWMTEQRGLSFIDAVKELALAAGMEMPAADPRAAEKTERQSGLVSASEAARAWFTEQLQGLAGGEARAYLGRRQISEDLVQAFGIGFAPDSRGKLKAALGSFGTPTLVEAGLLIAVDDKEPYDRFRGRLMIPIRDPRGRTIAFGGRIIGQGEPKYLNSPDTPLFDKGRTLYNVDRAGPASRKAGRLIVVEGYMDVIGLAGVDINEVVAPNGTAVTEAQLERMWRLAEVPILCFDGDAAGQKAAVRAAIRALPMLAPGRSLAFVTLPNGQDPDDLARSGGRAAVEAALAEARPLVDLLWRHEQAAVPLDTPESRAGLRQRLVAHADAIADPGVRDQYRIEFRSRFDALYGAPVRPPRAPFVPGRRQPFGRPLPQPTSDDARAIGRIGIDPTMARAIVAGLVLHPEVATDHAQALHEMALGDPLLERIRDVLVGAAFAGTLESGDTTHILAEAGLGRAAEDLRHTIGLAFSFLRSDADPECARRDLGEAIDVLVTRPQIDKALAEATRALAVEMDDAAFAEQQRLAAERRELERRLMDLMQPDAGA